MVEKNKHYNIEITDVTSDGNGVGKIDGFTVFVPLTVTGDTAEIVVIKVLSHYAVGRMLNLITPSPMRQEPQCNVYKRCGGCHLQHIKYDSQLDIKRGFIEAAMARIGGFDGFRVDEMLGMDSPTRYRNKCIFPIGADKNGDTVSGFYARRSHEIIPINDCQSTIRESGDIVRAVKEYMKATGVTPYDESTHTGLIRRVFIRDARSNDEIMVVVSVNGKSLPKPDVLISRLLSVSDKIVSVYININENRTNTVLGAENKLIYGKHHIEDTLCGIKFKISPHSFYQIIPYMTETLYRRALDYADISSSDTVLDVYCGIGTISLAASKTAKKVVGIEIVPQAVKDAKENAKNNGINNAEFYAESAETAVPKLIEQGMRPDIVILDPPRKGSDESTLNAIVTSKPKRIVYVSCNPSTLARDARYLSEHGYSPTKSTGVDMFPHTTHVETCVLLSKLKSSKSVTIDLDLDALETTAAEVKATYGEIKEYILNKYGFKVSSLNIAQVKKECGIIERENFNKPSGKYRQPNCPKHKFNAIKEALGHFKMI